MPSIQSYKITHNITGLNCLEKQPKILIFFKALVKLLAIIHQFSYANMKKLRSDLLSAVLYHWFPDIYAEIASFKDQQIKSCQNSQSVRVQL